MMITNGNGKGLFVHRKVIDDYVDGYDCYDDDNTDDDDDDYNDDDDRDDDDPRSL